MTIGIAGIGVDGVQVLNALCHRPSIRLGGVYDPQPEVRELFAERYETTAASSVDELCDLDGIDVVYVATPASVRSRDVLSAASHGKQVIVEKPMALSLEDSQQMIDAADAAGVRLQVGHSVSLAPAIREMARIVLSGRLGRIHMVHSWNFTEWLFRPRMAVELDAEQGGGVLSRQGPHQIDIVRMLGGGLVESVRGAVYSDRSRADADVGYQAFLEFENGGSGSVVYNGAAHFDMTDLTFGIGTRGSPQDPDTNLRAHDQLRGFVTPAEEWAHKASVPLRSGLHGSWAPPRGRHHPFFGFTIVNCERGDIRQTPDGLMVYTDEERREIPVPKAPASREELDLMYTAWAEDQPLSSHDGRWGQATLEVCLGIRSSARTSGDVRMSRQTPYSPSGHA